MNRIWRRKCARPISDMNCDQVLVHFIIWFFHDLYINHKLFCKNLRIWKYCQVIALTCTEHGYVLFIWNNLWTHYFANIQLTPTPVQSASFILVQIIATTILISLAKFLNKAELCHCTLRHSCVYKHNEIFYSVS